VSKRKPPAVDVDVDGALTAVAGQAPVELARIWATVDLDRTLASLGIEPGAGTAMADVLLGARVLVLPSGPDGSSLAVAEPITEGRLAATLARHGEGPAGRYLAVTDGLRMARDRAAATGVAVSRVEDGPFGPSMLLLIGPVSGPHLILCEPAAVTSAP
jgi:hypothetical protein